MNKLSYSETIAILGDVDYPFTAVSRDGVFIDTKGLDESCPEYEVIREMETAHPQKDIAKPLFTFPCSVEQLRDFLIDNEAVGQLSGVIYLEKDKTYTASDILALMLDANIKETALIHKNHSFYGFSQLYKESVLDDHQGQKTHYQQQIIHFLERYSMVVTLQNIDEELKNISFKNIMGNVVTWLQSERFAVFFNSQSECQNLNIKKYENLITTTLAQNSYDLTALPVGNGKKSGAKAFVWEQIGNQFEDRDSFDYYWKKLKRERVIVDAK